MKGRFITLEGGEGAGKSTLRSFISERIAARGIELVCVREPGGTAIGEAIRTILLDPENTALQPETELLLMFAARAQLVREAILPALARGAMVLSDRFSDASFAYQGGGRGIGAGHIAELERWVCGIKPDLSILLDLPVDQGLARVRGRGPVDRIEHEEVAFFERVRAAYLARATAEPERWRVINAGQPLEAVLAALAQALDAWFEGSA